jgi:RNA polymerase sigma-70 factor (ECF subfamily)
VKAWLFTVCRNRAFDLLRRDARSPIETSPPPENAFRQTEDPAEACAREDRSREVLACVDRLPKTQQDVVRLRFQQNLSYKEIAEITGMSPGNVGFVLHTAMHRLRAMLEARKSLETIRHGQP